MQRTRALLIVDVQNDFTEGGSLACQGGADVARRITEHLEHYPYDLVIASRDWHDADSDNGGHFALDAEPDFVNTWPVHCVAGTEGAEYHPNLNTERIDIHVRKGMGEPAYSAFEGETTDGRTLAEVLEEHGVTDLDIVGIATDYCVRASTLHALDTGVLVRVVDDLVASVAADTGERALAEMQAAGAKVKPAAKLKP